MLALSASLGRNEYSGAQRLTQVIWKLSVDWKSSTSLITLVIEYTNMKELTCRYGHMCTSGCGNDYDCPCQADHCCALTEGCDGTCDDCFNKDILAEAIGYDKSLLDNLKIT